MIRDTVVLPKLNIVDLFVFLESELNEDGSFSLGLILSSEFVQNLSHFTFYILTEKEEINVQ